MKSLMIVLIILGYPSKWALGEVTYPVKSLLNRAYCNTEGLTLYADFFRPDTSGQFPGLIAIHGGGWRKGNRESMHAFARGYAEQGFVVMTPSYRLASTPAEANDGPANDQYQVDAIAPAAVRDVRCAVRFMRSFKTPLHFNGNKIGSVGFSAGGHLALMLGHNSGNRDVLDDPTVQYFQSPPSAKVDAAVSFSGPTDLEGELDKEIPHPAMANFLGLTESPTEAEREAVRPLAFEMSPYRQVRCGGVPTQLHHGTNDPVVNVDHTLKMGQALSTKSIPYERYLYLGKGHGDLPFILRLERSIRFFHQYLGY